METMGELDWTKIILTHAEIGGLDRAAGLTIQTREQYRQSNPSFTGEDAQDIYLAYRAGFIGKK